MRHFASPSFWESYSNLPSSVQELAGKSKDYPDDKYGPSCLILSFTQAGRPLHIQCSYPSRPLMKIITLYEPDPAEWVEFRVRRM